MSCFYWKSFFCYFFSLEKYIKLQPIQSLQPIQQLLNNPSSITPIINNINNLNKKHIKKNINILQQCSGRSWSDYIFMRKTNKKVSNIDDKYKVDDFNDIDIKAFNIKYIVGIRCKNAKLANTKYCKLHTSHLIHGDYLETPSKELCYHYIKDGKYI